MTTIEERAKRICTNSFCNKLHKPICKTCIWRCNRELTELQCSVPEYKDAIESVYDSAICQLLLQRKELTKWNDPDEELPEYYKVVEIKYRISGLSRISIAWISAGDAGGYLWTIDGTDVLVNAKHVIGWRPIHE